MRHRSQRKASGEAAGEGEAGGSDGGGVGADGGAPLDAASAGDDGPGGGGKTEEDGEEERQGRLPFGTAYHVPVVCKEVSENSNERKTISKLPHNPSNRQPGEPRSCSVSREKKIQDVPLPHAHRRSVS